MEYEFKDFENVKRLRSYLLYNYVGKDKKYVCFSCGNTSKSLKKLGLKVLDISPNGDLSSNRWFTIQEIHDIFPQYFDATCGHLSMELMNKLSESYADYFYYLEEKAGEEVIVPTGSGETLCCLALAFPDVKFIARYGIDESTEFHEEAPLNKLVEQLAFRIEFADKIKEDNSNEDNRERS